MTDTARPDRGTDRDLPGERSGQGAVPDPTEDDVERALAALYGDDDDVADIPRAAGGPRSGRASVGAGRDHRPLPRT